MKRHVAVLTVLFGLAPLPALAADLGAPYPGASLDCSGFTNQRGYDDVIEPPKTAYIVASSCKRSSLDVVTLLTLGQREKILVYYDGGSMYKTDIDMLVVPR